MNEPFDLVFLCAGRGTRVGLDLPKQFVDLGGKPVMIHALERFERMPAVRRKIIVHDPVDADRVRSLLERYAISHTLLAAGGATRQESVRRGLELVGTPRLLTHNAAVPFFNEEMVAQVFAVDADCVTTATEVQDNLVRIENARLVPVARPGLRVINTPQAFRTSAVRAAHAAAYREQRSFNSDSELMLHYGHEVRLVSGPAWSFKITDRVDLALAETILARPDLFPGCHPISHGATQSHRLEAAAVGR